MVAALAGLIFCQLIGEVLRRAFHLPVPGPVIGMFLLAGVLVAANRERPPEEMTVPRPLAQLAQTLIGHMGLLFVPAGVGIIAAGDLLGAQWLPILAALLGSTLLGLAVTGVVMVRVMRRVEKRRHPGQRPPMAPAALADLCRERAGS